MVTLRYTTCMATIRYITCMVTMQVDMAKPNDSASLQHKHDKVPRQVTDIIKVYRIRRLVSMSPDTISWHESCYASHHGKIRCGQ